MKKSKSLRAILSALLVVASVAVAMACSTEYCYDYDWNNCQTWFFHEICVVVTG